MMVTLLFSSEYQKWIESQQEDFKQYKKTIDAEFTDMLKKDWQSFQTMYNPTPYRKPKPKQLPIIKDEIIIPQKEIDQSIKVTIKKLPEGKLFKKIKKIKKISDFKTANFNFFSTPIHIQYDPKTYFTLQNINNESISQFWDTINPTKHQDIIQQIKNYSQALEFNDWANYLLIHQLGIYIYKDQNMANLFTWFIMSKMGYDVKVGYNNSDVYILSTVKHKLYQVAFFTLKNKKYYVLTPKGRIKKLHNIYTYKGRYPNTIKSLNFAFNKPIKLYNDIQKRNLSFEYDLIDFKIKASYSKELVDFYKSFPQSDYQVYFNTTSTQTSYSLLRQLKPIVENRSELAAVNLILRFVQTSFSYKTDQKQFTYEKVFFPEETLFYPYSDCEDRSILFRFLVEELLGLDVVAVKYSNHLTTAVAFSSSIKGDSFTYKEKQYTMADATYINANVGMSMPKYKNKSFKIIP